jgi:hypothetical protein
LCYCKKCRRWCIRDLKFERDYRFRLKMLQTFNSAFAYIFKGQREKEEASPMGPLSTSVQNSNLAWRLTFVFHIYETSFMLSFWCLEF